VVSTQSTIGQLCLVVGVWDVTLHGPNWGNRVKAIALNACKKRSYWTKGHIMEVTATALPARASSVREVWASPLYRGATIAMFLSGLGTSAAAPQIVLYLVKDLGASLPLGGFTI
jgi:hypothetical protein